MQTFSPGEFEPGEEGDKGKYGSFRWLRDKGDKGDEVEDGTEKDSKVIEMDAKSYVVEESGIPFAYADLAFVLSQMYPEYGIKFEQILVEMELVRKEDKALLVSKFGLNNKGFSEDFGTQTFFTYSIKGTFNLGGASDPMKTELKKVTLLGEDEFIARYGTQETDQIEDNAELATRVENNLAHGKMPNCKVTYDKEQGKFIVDETKAYFDGKTWKILTQDLLEQEPVESSVEVPSRRLPPKGSELVHGFSVN